MSIRFQFDEFVMKKVQRKMKLKFIKLYSLVALIITVITIFTYYHVFVGNNNEFKSDVKLFDQLEIEESNSDLTLTRSEWFDKKSPSNCSLPINMDPFDPIIKSFIVNYNHDKFKCYDDISPGVEEMLKLTNGQQLTSMNDRDPIVVLKLPKKRHSVKCAYRPFELLEDYDLEYRAIEMIEGFSLNMKSTNSQFVAIKCINGDEKVYNRIHSWPLKVSQLIEKKSSIPTVKSDQIKPSVLILVLESTSRLNFERFMKQTSKSLNKLSSNFILKGLNIFGDDTWKNMIPLLTGHHVSYGEWSNHVDEVGPFDDLDLIWKDFKRADYLTGYIEDYPSLGLFNLRKDGFLNPPTDWYPRAHWAQMEFEMGYHKTNKCFGRQPKLTDWLKQVRQFVNLTSSSKLPYFLWSFLIEPLADNFNKIQYVDQQLADFINIYSAQLEDTVFILMGDHGPRFGGQMTTEYGQYESRLPLFNIHLPKKLTKRHPHLAKYLTRNQNRLTTWLDVREILKDIASGNYEELINSNEVKRAYSIWRQEVPFTRNCLQARIPSEYCSCRASNSGQVLQLSSLAVKKLRDH
ncbi:uncharacterized protein LOC128397954 [Panonychus citri]|uniref:uncharacterized protein LOC128397954 n=1 Tax=Panonychus citri TaxID=50023 RepID=UPI002307F492|nr:uncharacterized protein LOC128397954 [Panonychus citri]